MTGSVVLAAATGEAVTAVDAPTGASAAATTRSAQRIFVLVVLAAALAVRLGAVVLDDVYAPENDALHFDMIATSLADGDGYGDAFLLGTQGPSAYRAPLYPTTLAAVYVVFGDHSWTAGRVANALIGTALVALIGVVAAQLWGRRVGAAALVLAAVHPTLVLFGSGLQLEPLLATLIVAAFAAALQYRRRPDQARWAVLAGIAIGLAMLTRETGALLLPVIGALVWQAAPRGRRRWVAPVAVAAIAAALVVPWTLRNAVQLDALVPVTTSGGYTLAGTYNETSMDDPVNPGVWIPPERDPAMRDVVLDLGVTDEIGLDQALRAEAIEFAVDHPSYLAEVVLWNTVRLFDLEGPAHALDYATYVPYSPGLTRAAVYGSWLLGLAAVGGLLLRTARGVPWPVLVFPLLAIGFHSVVSGEIRYRATFEPFTVLLAAAAVVAVLDRIRSPREAHS